MTTAADWVEQTRSMLMGGLNEELNRLAGNYLPPAAGQLGVLSFEFDMGGIRPGARISVGRNTFYVWAVDSTNKSATVSGGYSGSTDIPCSDGDVVRVNPRFTDDEIFKALNDDLYDLTAPGNGLFQVGQANLQYSSEIIGYNLSNVVGMLSVIEIRQDAPGNWKDWPRIPSHMYRIMNTAPTGTDGFASGKALFIYEAGWNGYDVVMTYRKEFTPMTSLSSTKVSTGVPASAWDLPPIGAAINLMSGREIKRAFTESQGDTRRAAEVPNGASLASFRGLQLRRAQRIAAEQQRLTALYPIVKDA